MKQHSQLRINFIDNVNWIDIAENASYNITDTSVFRVDIDANLSHLTKLYNLLTAEEKERADRFLQNHDRIRTIIGRGVLRILLGRFLSLEPSQINIMRDNNKKPCFEQAGFPKISFNISHSGKWIILSFNNFSNGVDIEHVNASFDYQNLLQITCNEDEKIYIKGSLKPVDSFFELWTRKEALLKATGKGLTDDLSLIPGLNGEHQSPQEVISSDKSWNIYTFWVDANYLASLAVHGGTKADQFINFRL